MSSNDSSVLLAWMKQHPDHLNWDLTLAVCPEHINSLLRQTHAEREGSAVADLEGEVPVPSSQLTHVLSGYRLGPPQLETLSAAYASPKVRQTLALEGGSHLMMDKTEGLVGLALHDPLDPLRVRQELPLTADSEGVRIDLGQEDAQTELDLGGGLVQRQAAGQFFQAFARSLDSARRLQPLVDLSALSGNPYLGVRGSAVRTHVSQTDGRPALVVFAGLNEGPQGVFPGEQSDYPFLLPDDLQQPVSSTLLLSSRMLHRAAYATGLEGMLEGGVFEAVHDEDRTLVQLNAKAGQLRVPPGEYQGSEYQFRSDAFVIQVAAGAPLVAASSGGGYCPACSGSGLMAADGGAEAGLIRVAAPLSVEFDVDQIRQRWVSVCTLSFSYRKNDVSYWQQATATFRFDVNNQFHLVNPKTEESAGCMLLGQVPWPWQQDEVIPLSGLPADLGVTAKAEICEFVAFLIKQAVLEGLSHKLGAQVPEQVLEGLRLSGGHHLTPSAFQLPLGMALFANGNGALQVVDPPLWLAPAQRYQFRVDSPGNGVVWSVEALPGNAGDLGRIDPATGEYRAPPAHAMGGQRVRVRVVASTPSGQRATAVVTVLLAALTVNPLIRVCYIDDQLSLTAGTLEGELSWRVLDAEAEGRGWVVAEADGKRCTYHAAGKVEDNRTYVLDQVEVRNAQTDEVRLIHVLVRQRRPELVVKILEQLPDGRLQLQGWVNGQAVPYVQWWLPIDGTGQLDSLTAVYTPPAGDSTARFVLIMARFEMPSFGFLFEGHLILPLPLALHFDALRRIDQVAGLRAAATVSLGG